MIPSNPDRFIYAEIIDQPELGAKSAAEILGVRQVFLSALLNGRTSLSPGIALRIKEASAPHKNLLLQMQARIDAAQRS